MGWGWSQNTEHPHTLAIFSSFFFFLLQMHFSFIGKAQFMRATLFCDSFYFRFYSHLNRWAGTKSMHFIKYIRIQACEENS